MHALGGEGTRQRQRELGSERPTRPEALDVAIHALQASEGSSGKVYKTFVNTLVTQKS